MMIARLFASASVLALLTAPASAQSLPSPSYKAVTVGGSTISGVGPGAGQVAPGTEVGRAQAAEALAIPQSSLGQPNGAASLGSTGTVPLGQIPVTKDATGVASGADACSISGGTDCSGAKVTATGGNTPRTAAARAADHFNALDIGAKGDGVTDDAPVINTKIAALCATPNGGVIEFGNLTFAIASTVSNPCSNVHLAGLGRSGYLHHDVGSGYQYGTRFLWVGPAGGTMLSVAPPANATTGQHPSNDDVTGVLLDANGIAGTAAYFGSLGSSKIDIAFREPTSFGVKIDTVPLGEFNDPNGNEFRINGIAINNPATGIICDGTATTGTTQGNCSLNQFRSVNLTIMNGDGLVFGNSDHNIVDFLNVQRRPGGTGNMLVFNGGSLAGRFAYNNRLFYVTGNAPIVARGTTSFAYASQNNIIDDLDRNNGTPYPTIETGATALWRDDYGNFGVISAGPAGTPSSSFVAGNGGSTANGTFAFADGVGNNANGFGASAFGQNNNVSGADSTASGYGNQTPSAAGTSEAFGAYALTRSPGDLCTANAASLGTAQACTKVLRATGATASAIRLTADGAAAGAANVVNLPSTAVGSYSLRITLTGLDLTTPANTYSWSVPVAILSKTGAAQSTTALALGTPVTLATNSWAPTVSAVADTTNGGLNLSFTPPSGNTDTIHVVARVESVEVQ